MMANANPSPSGPMFTLQRQTGTTAFRTSSDFRKQQPSTRSLTLFPMADTKVNHGANNYGRTSVGSNGTSNLYANQYGARAQAGQGYGMHNNPVADFASLAHSFQGMNLQTQPFAAQAKTALMTSNAANAAAMSVAPSLPSSMYASSGQYVFPNSFAGNNTPTAHMYAGHNGQQYATHLAYHNYNNNHHDSPSSSNWTPITGMNMDIPTLITPRRDSSSSNENEQPMTPSYGGYSGYTAGGGVAINRSPSGVFTQGTSSPNSIIGPFMPYGKTHEHSEIPASLRMLLAKEPAIPRAIPAPSSPLKPLDRALENQRGETNVYIRGLLPETTDAMLEGWGRRFGDIKSSKSIIDHNTQLCKGFGFVKYHNYEDAETCIRGFHYLGYEVSFARESFYSKLKTFADEKNTNLYVSNLPKSMNEHELAQLFSPHAVASSRILRDKNGHGRGVGFARFDSRDACEEVIKMFNNHTIKSGGEEMQIQIRFADTQDQKSLKQQTQAARQFRSAEYEYATQAWRQGHLPGPGTTLNDNVTNDFESYLATSPGVPRWTQPTSHGLAGRSLQTTPATNGAAQQSTSQRSMTIDVQNGAARENTPDGKQSAPSATNVQVKSPADSVIVE